MGGPGVPHRVNGAGEGLGRTKSTMHLQDIQGYATSILVERRQKLGYFLDTNKTLHLLTFALLICDVIVVLAEIFWDLDVLGKNECLSDTDCPRLRFALNGSVPIRDGVTCRYNTSFTSCVHTNGANHCVVEGTEGSTNPEDVLHTIGLSILSIFTVEIFVKIFAFGFGFFNLKERKLELFDAFVVITSLVLDLVFTYAAHSTSSTKKGAELLVLLRLWRFFRILNGSVVATGRRGSGKRKVVQNMCNKCQVAAAQLTNSLDELQAENDELKARIGILEQHSTDEKTSIASDYDQTLHAPMPNMSQKKKKKSVLSQSTCDSMLGAVSIPEVVNAGRSILP